MNIDGECCCPTQIEVHFENDEEPDVTHDLLVITVVPKDENAAIVGTHLHVKKSDTQHVLESLRDQVDALLQKVYGRQTPKGRHEKE